MPDSGEVSKHIVIGQVRYIWVVAGATTIDLDKSLWHSDSPIPLPSPSP